MVVASQTATFAARLVMAADGQPGEMAVVLSASQDSVSVVRTGGMHPRRKASWAGVLGAAAGSGSPRDGDAQRSRGPRRVDGMDEWEMATWTKAVEPPPRFSPRNVTMEP